MLEHQSQVLASGLKIITIPIDSVKSLTVMALSNTGSRYEAPDQYGIAHFLEHMVFKGTKNYPTAQVLSEAVDSIGANFNAFTGKEYTGYYVQVASKHYELALDVVSDMLLTPQLRQEDIDREKGVIIEEMNMYADMPASHIDDLFEEMAFADTGLSHHIVGTKKTVSAVTSADFKEFLSDWYGLNNMVLVVAGDKSVVGSKDLLTAAEKMFAKTGGKTCNPKRIFEKNVLSDKKNVLKNKKTEQAHFVFGWSGINRGSEDRYALSLLSALVGGNMSSRLFSEVREKRGLCYYVHSEVKQFHEGGMFGGSAGVDPKRLEEAIKVSLDEFTKIAEGKQPVTAAELNRAKEYAVGKMILGLENSESVAQYFGLKQLLHGSIQTPDEAMTKLRAVSLEEVQSLAERLIAPGGLKFGLIGDFDQEKISDLISKY